MTYFTQHLPPVSVASQGPPTPTDKLNVAVERGRAAVTPGLGVVRLGRLP